MAKDAKASNGLRFEGFIEIEKINKKNHTRELYHNTITKAGKQLFLAKSAGQVLQMSGDIFGNVACENNLAILGGDRNNGRYARSKVDITNVLLNLSSEELNALGADTNCINVWNDNFTANTTKLIGYANNNLIPLDNSREGVVDYCKDEYIADGFTVAKRWKYAEGVATGTINAIAMMPFGCANDFAGGGLKFSKCIDKVNPQYTLYSSMSTGFLIPGVNGYTANNEVLLNFNKDGKNRWKYNIASGEMDEVDASDPFFIPTPYSSSYTIQDMIYLDGYLYTLEINNIDSSSSATIYVQVFDTNNNMNRVTSFSIYDNSSYAYIHRVSFIVYNNELYVSTTGGWNAISSSYASYSINKLWKLTMGGSGYYNAAGTAQQDYSALGFSLPSGLHLRMCGLGRYGSNYVLYVPERYDSSTSTTPSWGYSYSTAYRLTGYVFTNLSDPMGSLVKILSRVHKNEILFSTGACSGSLRIGLDFGSSASYENYSDDVAAKYKVINNSNSSGTAIDTENTGCWLSLDGWSSNVLSFVQLTTAIEKTANDIIYVSYGYKIV